MNIVKKLRSVFMTFREENAETAYDKWAAGYDVQDGNLVLDLDNKLFAEMMASYEIKDKTILDVGCGTGRHWHKIYEQHPRRLIGYDISKRMLDRLREKFPQAEIYHSRKDSFSELSPSSCDCIISTLALAHIPAVDTVLKEWNRVLKPGGSIFITDYHPDSLAKGGRRTFNEGNKTIAVRSYVYPVTLLRKLAGQLEWTECRFIQNDIDETTRSYYLQKNALHLFEKFKGTPLVYAIHFVKQ